MPVTTRPLTASDEQRWRVLWHDYLVFYDTELADAVTDRTWQRLLAPDAGHDGIVALDDAGRIIGFALFLFHASTWTTGCYCYLEDLYVDAAARGLGAGGALIDGVEAAARERGCTRLYLTTRETNAVARRLYDKKLGPAEFVRYAKPLA